MNLKKTISIGVALLGAHLVLRDLRDREPDIHYVDTIPANLNAICIPPMGIFVHESQQGNAELLKHEMVHWRQYQRLGLARYYVEYLAQYLQHGYDNHPMEREARQNETPFVQANYTDSVRRGLAKTVYNPNFRKE